MEYPVPLDGISIELSTSKGRPLYVYTCIECSYITAKRNHAKMHVERIHVKKGKPMPRKRKFELQDGQYQISDVFMARKKRRSCPSSKKTCVQPSVNHISEPEECKKKPFALGFLTCSSHLPLVKQKPPSHGPDVQLPTSGWLDLGCLPDGAKITRGSTGWVRVSRMQSSLPGNNTEGSHTAASGHNNDRSNPSGQYIGPDTYKEQDASHTAASQPAGVDSFNSYLPLFDDDFWDGLAFPLAWDEAWDGAF